MSNKLLKFGNGNAKLSVDIATFSLPAGHTCPAANECLSSVNRLTGKVTDGKDCQFRCFAASQECIYRNVRNNRWHNYDLLRKHRTVKRIANLIQQSLPKFNFVRVHVSGDFYSESYFVAWLNVAIANPDIVFYGYTKMLPFLVKYKEEIPSNFRFTASKGGKFDHLIEKHDLKFAEVVFSVNEAMEKNLEIDHDDSHAIFSKESFGLLLHGTQPEGSTASKALSKLKKLGLGSYSRKPKQVVLPSKNVSIYIGVKIKSKQRKVIV